jgi:signal transduction histidine kinase
VWRLVAASLVLTVAAELAFTQYVSVYGSANLAGHFLRLIASYLLYKAIIETGLVEPFGLLLRELKLSEARLEEYAAALESANAELRRSELRERAADLAERNQDLDAFARTVAHDLKSPVAAIVTAARTVSSYELPREQAKALLKRVGTTASDLSDIIDNLLLLARVRKEEAPRESVEMAQLVAAVRYRFEGMIREHEADVVVPDDWPRVLGHGPWIEEVWANLITNALKYGGPRPRIELGASTADNGTVRFWVRDHGPGIQPAARAWLFVPFHQLGVGRGHGLGLSIVLQIVQKLGGDVGVESEPGQGSLFYFTLPADHDR